MKRYVIGDIHGGYKGLVQVLDRVSFDYENDELIALGDVTDGWSQTAEAIELLMTIKNLVYIKGNHDEWTERFLKHVIKHGDKVLPIQNKAWGGGQTIGDPHIWLVQGGLETVQSYKGKEDLVEKHVEFLSNAKLYHIDEENRIFLHAGFNPEKPIDEQSLMDVGQKEGENATYYWDRSLWREMKVNSLSGLEFDTKIEPYKEIYIGHTPTTRDFKHGLPVNIGNLWNMDTGAAYDGRISLMDIDTKEIVQSDRLQDLYPNEDGRN